MFRIKQLEMDAVSASQMKNNHCYRKYRWDKLGFSVQFSSTDAPVIMGWDLPAELRSSLIEQFSFTGTLSYHEQVGKYLAVVVQEVVKWYDAASWKVRDVVRDIEKVCGCINKTWASEQPYAN